MRRTYNMKIFISVACCLKGGYICNEFKLVKRLLLPQLPHQFKLKTRYPTTGFYLAVGRKIF